MPEFGISQLGLPPTTFLPISREEFEQVLAAKAVLLEALATEEAFDLLLANFAEFEREMLDLTLGNLMYADRDWTASMDQIQGLNRRLLNLLSAGRLYLDHLPQRVAAIIGRGSVGWQAIDTIRRAQYDNLLGYRVMEELRNYIQHRSLPIRAVRHEMRRLGEDDAAFQIRNVLTPLLDIDHIEEDKALKQEIIEELRQLGRQVDLKPFVREYLQGLGAIHERLRAEVAEPLQQADAVYDFVSERWKAAGGVNESGLAVIERREDGTHVRAAQVFHDLIARHGVLTKKNQRFGQFRRHYVSSEVVQEAPRARAARR